MNVSDVMTRAVDYIGADESVREASWRMKNLAVRALAVVTDSEAVGLVTDRDIALRLGAEGLDPEETRVAAVMTRGIVVCREEDDLRIAARMMERRRIRQLVVINRKGRLSGIVSAGALAERLPPAAAARLLQSVLDGRPGHPGGARKDGPSSMHKRKS